MSRNPVLPRATIAGDNSGAQRQPMCVQAALLCLLEVTVGAFLTGAPSVADISAEPSPGVNTSMRNVF